MFMSNLYNTETSVTSTLSYSRPEMGVGVSLQVDTVLSETYVQSQNCQPDVGTWASAAAGQSRDIMSVSTIAPVTLKGRDKTLQMLIGEINKQTQKLDKFVKRRLVKPGNMVSMVCYVCRQEGHMAHCCPQQGNWGANSAPQSNHASAPGVVSTTQTISVTVQARTTTTRANGAVQQGVQTFAPQDSVSLSGWLLVIRVMFQWVVDIMNWVCSCV